MYAFHVGKKGKHSHNEINDEHAKRAEQKRAQNAVYQTPHAIHFALFVLRLENRFDDANDDNANDLRDKEKYDVIDPRRNVQFRQNLRKLPEVIVSFLNQIADETDLRDHSAERDTKEDRQDNADDPFRQKRKSTPESEQKPEHYAQRKRNNDNNTV